MRSLVVFLRVVFGSAAAVLGFLFHSPPSFGAVLIPADAIRLEKTQGRFDFLRIDPARHRLLLAHTGNKSLDIIDLDSERLLKSVSTGAAQDSAIDLKNHRYFVSVS